MVIYVCHIHEQMVDRDTKMKSKSDPTSRDREKNPGGEKLCLFQDMRSTGEFGVV